MQISVAVAVVVSLLSVVVFIVFRKRKSDDSSLIAGLLRKGALEYCVGDFGLQFWYSEFLWVTTSEEGISVRQRSLEDGRTYGDVFTFREGHPLYRKMHRALVIAERLKSSDVMPSVVL